MSSRVLLALVALLVAGCATPPAPEASPTGTPGPGAQPDAPATLWPSGTTWAWTLTSSASGPVPITTVSAGADGAILVGATETSALLHALAYHIVPIGRVGASDLAWQAHGTPVALLDLPLAEGKTWTRDLWMGPGVVFTATRAPSGTWSVVGAFEDGSKAIVAEWDDARQTFVSIASHFGAEQPFAKVELDSVSRGDASGVLVPEVRDAARLSVRATVPPAPAPPTTFSAGDADLVALACFRLGTQGAHSVTVAAPSGATMRCAWTESVAGNGFFAQSLPAEPGSWSIVTSATGEGSLSAEVVTIKLLE